MTGAVTLREMTAADLPAVLDLEHALFGDEAWTEGMLASELAGVASGRYYLVAEDGGGTGRLRRPADPRRRPGRRAHAGRGRRRARARAWARRCWTRCWPRRAGAAAREVFLEVRVDNHRAQRLYQRRGFVEIGIRRGYYQPSGTDALVMRLSLDRPGAAPRPARGTRP